MSDNFGEFDARAAAKKALADFLGDDIPKEDEHPKEKKKMSAKQKKFEELKKRDINSMITDFFAEQGYSEAGNSPDGQQSVNRAASDHADVPSDDAPVDFGMPKSPLGKPKSAKVPFDVPEGTATGFEPLGAKKEQNPNPAPTPQPQQKPNFDMTPGGKSRGDIRPERQPQPRPQPQRAPQGRPQPQPQPQAQPQGGKQQRAKPNLNRLISSKELLIGIKNNVFSDKELRLYGGQMIGMFKGAAFNFFDYDTNPEREDTCLAAIKVCGNLEILQSKEKFNCSRILNEYENNIGNNGVSSSSDMLICGMMRDFLKRGVYSYDEIPNNIPELLNNYLQGYTAKMERRMSTFDYGQQNPFGNAGYSDQPLPENLRNFDAIPEFGNMYGDASMTQNGLGYTTFSNIRPTQVANTFKLSKGSYVIASYPNSGIFKTFRDKLFSSRDGSMKAFNACWKEVIKQINNCCGNNKGRVRDIKFDTNIIFVNDKAIILDGLLGGEYGIQIEDFVDFKDLFAKYPNIRSITINSDLIYALQRAYPPEDDYIYNTMTANKRLNLINIVPVGETTPVPWTRASVCNGKLRNLAKDHAKRERVKQKTEQFAAENNPRLARKSPGYKNRVFDLTRSLMSEHNGRAINALRGENPSIKKWAKTTAFTLGIGAVGTAATIITLPFSIGAHMFKKFSSR